MKELFIQLPKRKAPKYRQIADGIRNAIREGQLKPAELLPSSRTMADRFRVHRHTVMSALAELEAEGWVITEERRHYRVVATLPSTFLHPKVFVADHWRPRRREVDFARTAAIADHSPKPGYQFAFPSGFPDLRLFPMREFKSHLYDALKSQTVLNYGDPVGHYGLIKEIETYLRRTRSVDQRVVLVTNGSQEAIFLLAQLLIRPGDSVAIEGLGYPPAIEALRFAGAKLVPIKVDGEGLVVDDLEEKLKKKKIKLLYTTPLHQYPTTVTLSASRRLKLYEVAYRNNLLILEDDYDHEFHYSGQPVAPLASFDPGNIVLYVSTFSKVLFPSARVGFMAVPATIGKEIAKLKKISSRQNEQILQDAIARWMKEGGFERHLRRMRRIYEERCNSFLKDLERLHNVYPQISWIVPDGGMALWLDVKSDSKRLAEAAQKRKILVSSESQFRWDGKPGTHLRLGFSGQTPAENAKGLEALGQLF